MIAPTTVALLFGAALLVFGPKKLPELGKSLGQALGNFKKAMNDAQDDVAQAINTENESKSELPKSDSQATTAKSENDPPKG